MDADGMPIDVLEETLDRLEREGRRPKFIYTIPNFQNPGGVTMSLPRRRRLVEVAAERELLVLEDNPYGLLRYEGEPLPTLMTLSGGDFIIYLGTFSKILSAGLRLGWAVAPAPVLAKMNLGKQGADLCSSSLTQHFVSAYFAEGRWEPYLESLKDLYRGRRDTLLAALDEHFPPEATWTSPEGGLFVWATLPDGLDSKAMMPRAIAARVAYVPGTGFYADGTGAANMRLNFSYSEPARLREGVRRLAGVMEQELALRAVFGPSVAGRGLAGPHRRRGPAAADAPGPDLA
jgi:2-aminoadipate transaminase